MGDEIREEVVFFLANRFSFYEIKIKGVVMM